MKLVKKIMTLMMCMIGVSLAFLSPSIGEAKEITLNGSQAGDAIITDSEGNNVTGNTDLNMWKEYNIHYDWSVPDGVTINNGDTATFIIPDNVNVNVAISFPVKDTQGHVIGTFTVPKGSHTGTLTFNDHYEQYPMEKIHGSINFGVTGTTDNGVSEQNPVVKSGWFDKETQIPTWNISYNHQSEDLTNVVITDTLHGEQEFVEGSIIVQYGHYEGDQFIVEKEDSNPSYVTIDGKTLTANIGDISQAVQIRYQTIPTNYQEGDKLYLENIAHASSDQLGESSDMASLDAWGNGSADGTAGNTSTSESITMPETSSSTVSDSSETIPTTSESNSNSETTTSEDSTVTESTTSESNSDSETTTSEDSTVTESTTSESNSGSETTTSEDSTVIESTTSESNSNSESTSTEESTSEANNVPGGVIIPETSSSSTTPSNGSNQINTVYEDKQMTEAINNKEKKLLPQTGNKKQMTLSFVGFAIIAIALMSTIYIKKKAH